MNDPSQMTSDELIEWFVKYKRRKWKTMDREVYKKSRGRCGSNGKDQHRSRLNRMSSSLMDVRTKGL